MCAAGTEGLPQFEYQMQNRSHRLNVPLEYFLFAPPHPGLYSPSPG